MRYTEIWNLFYLDISPIMCEEALTTWATYYLEHLSKKQRLNNNHETNSSQKKKEFRQMENDKHVCQNFIGTV